MRGIPQTAVDARIRAEAASSPTDKLRIEHKDGQLGTVEGRRSDGTILVLWDDNSITELFVDEFELDLTQESVLALYREDIRARRLEA